MEFFILLSSIAGIIGSPGQSNYAAGCTFQDALARSRTTAGYRASVSINLGRMRTIGIVAETEEYRRIRLNDSEMAQVEEVDLFALLDHYCNPLLPVVDAEHSQVLIGVLTKAHYQAHGRTPNDILNRPLFAAFDAPPLYAADGNTAGVSMHEDPASLFRQATGLQDRSAVAVSALMAKLARILDVAAEDIDPHRTLSDYGTDSLMAVELRNWIRRDFGVTVAIFDIIGVASIKKVGQLVAERAED
jgi:acyl carrier protein